MNLKVAQVIGLNTDQKAAQATSSVRNGDNSFFAVLTLSCDDAFTKGRQALSDLSDFYFEFEGGAGEKLNATFKQAQEKFPQDSEFDLGLAAISGKILYLIGSGEVEVYLKRDNKLVPLLSVGTPQQLISGFLQLGDRLLFSTKSLINFLGDDLEKSLSLPIETFEEEVGSRIGASDLENQGLAGLAVEALEEQEKQDIPALPKEEQEQVTEQEITPAKANFQAIFKRVLSAGLSLGRYFPKSGRGRLALGVVLIVIIALGVGYQYKVSKDKETNAEFNRILQEAKDDLNSAKGLSTLNPADAKGKLDSAKDKVVQALNIKPKDIGAQNLKKQIDDESSSILQQESVSDFPLFLDLDLVKKNFRGEQLSLSAGKLLILDPGTKTLVSIDLAKKSNQILAGSQQLGEANRTSLNGGLAFIYSTDKGILRLEIANQKVTAVSRKDDDWGEIKDIYGFAGNIYLLDARDPSTGSGQVWKYLPTADGYSDKREYLTKNTKADFTGSLRMQIESSIYVLKQGGEILRFTKGDKDNFSYSSLPSGVKDPKSFFVSSDTDNLYLLDSGNARLLVLTKTGSYKAQYQSERFAAFSDLVVDEKGKKMYLLDGSKIYTIDLK